MQNYILQITATTHLFTDDEVIADAKEAKLQVRQTTFIPHEEYGDTPMQFHPESVKSILKHGMESAHDFLCNQAEDELCGNALWENGTDNLWVDYKSAVFTFISPSYPTIMVAPF